MMSAKHTVVGLKSELWGTGVSGTKLFDTELYKANLNSSILGDKLVILNWYAGTLKWVVVKI